MSGAANNGPRRLTLGVGGSRSRRVVSAVRLRRCGGGTPMTIIALFVAGLLLSFAAYWWSWSRGFAIASASGVAGKRFIVREIPHATGLLSMFFGTTDYAYRMEYWRWPHFIHDCRTFSGESYRAKTARIDATPERCIFYLDDTPYMALTAAGEWARK